MKHNIRLMYDEQDDCLRLIKNGFTDSTYNYWEALTVAKYYRHVLGYGDARVKSSLLLFCKEADKNFRPVLQRNSIKNVVKNSRLEFRETSATIGVTKSELDSIRTIKNFKYQLVLLALLVLAKRKKRNSVYVNEWRYVRRITSKYITNDVIREALREAYLCSLLEEPRESGIPSHKLVYVDTNNNSEFVICIRNDKDMFNMQQLYKNYCGGELCFCKVCGAEVIKNGKNHKYCAEHWRLKTLEKHRKYNEKRSKIV